MSRKAKTKPISFPEDFYEEYDYIDTMKNASEYVRNLIRKDRLEQEEDIEKLSKEASDLILKIELLKQKNKTNEC